jgi:signal transduction histidine kinase
MSAMQIVTFLHRYSKRWFPELAFIATYLSFDEISYIAPLYGLNITPWNPDPALGLVFWLRFGRRAALPWFIALILGDLLVRGLPAGWPLTIAFSVWLTIGYGTMGEIMRRFFRSANIFDNRRQLLIWLAIVGIGTILNSLIYISLLYHAHLIPHGQWDTALPRFWIGDIVGMLVSMPLFWILAGEHGWRRLWSAVGRFETLGYIALAACVLLIVFKFTASTEYRHFYFLFLPIIWAAARQGLAGSAFMAFVLQIGIMCIIRWGGVSELTIFELQLLGAVLSSVGYFIGVVVDEQRQIADELKHTLRLAAAGEMAAALAHELNQPMTALSAYGKACELLLERGETGVVLKDAIHRMIVESGRASEVVRRLRDFFMTGSMQLEAIEAETIVSAITQQFVSQFQEQNVELVVAPIPAVSVIADRVQIELVLRNLLDNALDSVMAQPTGKRRVVLASDDMGGGRFRFSVEDSGSGVSEAIAARLFEPFVSTKSSGLGLGLVLSRAIVEAHGGNLWAEVGDHGIFRFILPLAETGEDVGK